MAIAALGPITGAEDLGLSPRERVLLAVLAMRRGQVVSPDELSDAIWGPDPPSTWPKQIQASVGAVRRGIGASHIETVGGGYRLRLDDAEDLDVARFEALVARARALVASGEADRAAATFTRALSLWHGEAYPELVDWPGAHAERARLDGLRRDVEEDLLEARLAAGEHREVATDAEVLVWAEPLRERRWAILALALYRCGRQGDALHALQRARTHLVEALGIDRGPDLVALERAVLEQDPSLAAQVTAPVVSDRCPYPGLAPYDTGDGSRFFGRDEEIAACLARLDDHPVLVVTGSSGSGKSSLVRAGLLPAMRERGVEVVVLAPGDLVDSTTGESRPEAWEALVSPTGGVVVVDQFEELAARAPGPALRATCDALAAIVARGGRLVFTVRADHLASLAEASALGPMVEHGVHVLVPLRGEALRAAIVEPARQAGLRVEEGLVEVLLHDAEDEAGALPLLSHALVETWRRRDGRVLTVEAYRASGGIRGAVARSADRVHDALTGPERTALRGLLLRLVAPSPDGDLVRHRLPIDVVRSDPALAAIVERLVRARLVTAEPEAIGLAHESLARAWPRLRAWLEEDAEGNRALRHLTSAAQGWESLGRPDSELYRGARLEAALELQERGGVHLTPVEAAFLEESRRCAENDRLALEARARDDARRNSRLRGALTAAAVLLLVALVAAGMALDRGHRAEVEADRAAAAVTEMELEALVNRSLALRSTDRAAAALIAVEAARRWPGDPRATSALLATFTDDPGFHGHRFLPDAASLDGVVLPGGEAAVVVVDGSRLELVDLRGEQSSDAFSPADVSSNLAGRVLDVQVSADGGRLAELRSLEAGEGCWDLEVLRRTNGAGCGAVVVRDAADGRIVGQPIELPFGPGAIALSENGRLLAATGGYDGELVVIRVDDGEIVGRQSGLPRPAGASTVLGTAGVAFQGDGTVVLGSMAGTLRVVTPEGAVRATIAGAPMSSNQHVAAGTDGFVVTGGFEHLLGADLATGAVRWTVDLRGVHPDPCPSFTVTEDRQRLYCGDHFGVIHERDRRTGQRTEVALEPQLGAIGDLATTDAGDGLVAFGGDAPAISRWSLDGSGPITRLVAPGHVLADGFDPAAGAQLVVAAREAGVSQVDRLLDHALWDVAADRETDDLEGFPAEGVGWAGIDTLIGFLPARMELGWYDTATGAGARGTEIPPTCYHIWPSAGGSRAYCGFEDGDVWTLDPRERRRIHPDIRVNGPALSVSATRGGARVVVTAAGPEGSVTTVHDGHTGELLAGPEPGPRMTSVSLDGLLVGARAGEVTKYDLETLRPLGDLPGARGEVNTLQFSEDSAVLLATSNDQTVSVYDVASGIRLGDPIRTSAPFSYPGYLRSDGRALAVTAPHGVQVWDLHPNRLERAACKIAGRNLSQSEWSTYMSDLGAYRATCPVS